MTELPHVFGVMEGQSQGAGWLGLASEGLPPKWFTKDPETRFEEDLPAMVESIRNTADLANNSTYDSVFSAWHSLYEQQDCWAQEQGCPPLLAHLGTSFVERMLIDGFCRSEGLSFVDAVHSNALEIDLGRIHPELAGTEPSDWLPARGDPLSPDILWDLATLCGWGISQRENALAMDCLTLCSMPRCNTGSPISR